MRARKDRRGGFVSLEFLRLKHLTNVSLPLARRAARAEALVSRRQNVLKGIKKGIPYRVLSTMYGMSVGAISMLARGNVAVDAPRGRPTTLPVEVELILVQQLTLLARNAMSIEVCKLSEVVINIAKKLELDIGTFVAGPKWLAGFLARHRSLAKRLPSKTNQARLVHFNRLTVAEWYAACGPLFAQYKPEELWNMDDTSFDLESIYKKVSAAMGG
jgi:hypothetical protein